MTDRQRDARVDALLDVFTERVKQLGLVVGRFRRDDHRPVAAYPKMPAATCYSSARALAAVYPELVAVRGQLVAFTRADGTEISRLAHAWNLRGDGLIVDSTLPDFFLQPDAVARAALVYVESDGGWPSEALPLAGYPV